MQRFGTISKAPRKKPFVPEFGKPVSKEDLLEAENMELKRTIEAMTRDQTRFKMLIVRYEDLVGVFASISSSSDLFAFHIYCMTNDSH